MASYYARPNLNNWSDTTGWSLTSGGPSAGATPSTGDAAIFDGNSGLSRTITIDTTSAGVGSLSTVGANPMTFTGGYFFVFGPANFTGTAAVNNEFLSGGGSLIAGGTPMSLVRVYDLKTLYIDGDLVCSGLGFYTPSTTSTIIARNGANVTAPGVSLGASNALYLGTGTWNFTAASGALIANSGTLADVNTATIKASGGGASVKTLTLPGVVNAIVNETTGTGGLQLSATGGMTNFTARPGSKTLLPAGATTTVANFFVDGEGSDLTIQSTTTTRATLAKSGGGQAMFRYASLKDINFSPASTFRGAQCKDLGNNLNFDFIKTPTNFFHFC